MDFDWLPIALDIPGWLQDWWWLLALLHRATGHEEIDDHKRNDEAE